MMQLAVYLDAGHRALGKWKRNSCRLNYYIEGGSLLEWSRFAMTQVVGNTRLCPQRAMLLKFVRASNSSTPLAIVTLRAVTV